MCVTAQLPLDRGGGGGKVLFIDADKSFSSSRVLEIADRLKLNYTDILDNICLARAYNTDHLAQLLIQARAMMSEGGYEGYFY